MVRGPLRFIILAAVGQDVNRCIACQCCYVKEALETRCDLAMWEVLVAAQQNDEAALTNQTIWVLYEAGPDDVCCINGLDVVAVARVLCQEACLRGLAAQRIGVKREP